VNGTSAGKLSFEFGGANLVGGDVGKGCIARDRLPGPRELVEPTAEGDELGIGQLLPPRDDHKTHVPGGLDRARICGRQRLGKVDLLSSTPSDASRFLCD